MGYQRAVDGGAWRDEVVEGCGVEEWTDWPRVVRELPAGYGGGDGDDLSDEEWERFLRRGEKTFTDEEVERLEALAEKIGTRSAQLHAAEQELLEWIAEFDRLEGWRLHGHRNCTEWLAFWTGLDRRTARARVRVARALEALPQTKASMRSGRLSFSKARAIVRLGELAPEAEETIVEFAEKTTAAEVEKLVRRRRTLDRVDEAERERRRHASRTLAVVPDDQGMYLIQGRLDPEVGAVLMRAIEAATDALYKVAKEEPLGPEPPKPDQRRADAIGLLAERALAAGFGGENGPVGPQQEGVTGSATRSESEPENGPAGPGEEEGPPADAGEPGSEMESGPCACGGHGTDASSALKGTRPEHYQVFLYLDPDALLATGDPNHTHLEDGTRLAWETARRLTCDSAIVPVLEDEQGSVLDIGRRTRSIPPAIRRALWLRDGGCRFPGCGLRFTQGHHVRHWALGGKTCMDNLVSLCRVHHRAVHEDGFRVKARGEGRFKFYSPEGWPLGDTTPRMDVELGDPVVELIRENRRRGVSPRWDDPSAEYASEVYIPDRLLFRAWEASED